MLPGEEEEQGADDWQDREQPEILQDEEQRDGQHNAHPRAAGERERDGDGECRHDHGRPRAVPDVEEQPRHRRADHQHQQTRVGHVVPERALRPLAEMVVVEHPVLHDAQDRAGSADGDDDVEDRQRAVPARQLVDRRHQQEQDELLGVDEARAGIRRERRRHQRPRRVHHQRPEEPRGFPSLLPQHQRAGPAGQRERQADSGRRNRQLQRGHEPQQAGNGRPFQAVTWRRPRHQGHRRHDRVPKCAMRGASGSRAEIAGPPGLTRPLGDEERDMARSAAATTLSAVREVRQRKSECTH